MFLSSVFNSDMKNYMSLVIHWFLGCLSMEMKQWTTKTWNSTRKIPKIQQISVGKIWRSHFRHFWSVSLPPIYPGRPWKNQSLLIDFDWGSIFYGAFQHFIIFWTGTWCTWYLFVSITIIMDWQGKTCWKTWFSRRHLGVFCRFSWCILWALGIVLGIVRISGDHVIGVPHYIGNFPLICSISWLSGSAIHPKSVGPLLRDMEPIFLMWVSGD